MKDSSRTHRSISSARTPRGKATVGCLAGACFVWGMDLQLLSSSFRALEMQLGFSPGDLSMLAIGQGVSSAVAGPVWAYVVDAGIPRKPVLVFGALAWGVITAVLAVVTDFRTIMILRVLNGITFGMMPPILQSMGAELGDKSNRGAIFGLIFSCQDVGQLLSIFWITPISMSTVLGFAGWRFAYLLVALFSWIVALVLYLGVEDDQRRALAPGRISFLEEITRVLGFFTIPTFTLLCVQGILCVTPYAALGFATMYFQYLDLSDFVAGTIFCLFMCGSSLGRYIGGLIGDTAVRYAPTYGRIATAMLTAIFGIGFAAVIFGAVPRSPDMAWLFCLLMFLFGLLNSWGSTGCVRPMLCEIVDQKSLAYAFSWENAIVFFAASFLGPAAVAYMSHEFFGYEHQAQDVQDMDPADRARNASALGRSLLCGCVVPWFLAVVVFLAIARTYPHDIVEEDDKDGERVPLVTDGKACSA